jgi:hypothetical protein
MPDIRFGWESVSRVLDEPNIRDLIQAQYDELAGFTDVLDRPDPDVIRMLAAEKAGAYRMWCGRSNRLLMGIIEWHIGPTFHHRSVRFGLDGGHFLHPEFRGVWIWLTMWRESLEALRKLGVRVVIAHDNPERPMAAAFKRLGMSPAGQMFARAL